MKRILTHVRDQPFVFTVGIAALIHGTWSLGTFFAGVAPTIVDWGTFAQWIAWVTPAFLIAFALDVGQIVTSAEIRAGNHTWQKYLTFLVFAVATYYLQWLYIAHHMPVLPLALGVEANNVLAVHLRDLAVWIIPALLPVSTLLYTFSHGHKVAYVEPVTPVELPKLEPKVKRNVVGYVGNSTNEVTSAVEHAEYVDGNYVTNCPRCKKVIEKNNVDSLRMALTVHLGRYCKSKITSVNGNTHVHASRNE